MTESILESIIVLLIIMPIIFITLKYKNEKKWSILIIFISFFITNQFLLDLPRIFNSLNLIGGDWNWTGKLYAIIGSFIFYLTFKKYLKENYFKIEQSKNSIKPNLILIILLLTVGVLFSFFQINQLDFNFETLGFQFTVAGFDEEIAFRGLLIGFLSTILNDKLKVTRINLGNPTIWVTAILFGLVHGLSLNQNLDIKFDFGYFIITFLYGFIWGWMTIKSKSILTPIISHNILNVGITIISMIK